MPTHTVLSYHKNGNKIDRVVRTPEVKNFNGIPCYTRHNKTRYTKFFKYSKHFLIIGKPTNAPGYICLDTLQDDPDERPHSFLYWVVDVREWVGNGEHLFDGIAVKGIERLAENFKIVNGEWEAK